MNANMTPGARIPRNAIRVWQSNETIAKLSGPELTKSLRTCLPSGRLDHVHPKDWPARETAHRDVCTRPEFAGVRNY